MMVGGQTAWPDVYDSSSAVYNSTKGANYSTLYEALANANSSGDVILLYKDVTASRNQTGSAFTSGTSVTIKNAEGVDVTITADNTAILGGLNGTFEKNTTGSLTIDCNNKGGSCFQPVANASLTFKGVTFKNSSSGQYNPGSEYSVIDFTGSGSGVSVTLDNVTFNSIASHAVGFRRTGCTLTIQNGITFTSCTFDNTSYKGALYFNTTSATVNVDATTCTALASSAMSIGIYSTMTSSYTITGGTAATNFTIANNDNYGLGLSDSDVKVYYQPTTYNATKALWYDTFANAFSAAGETDELQLARDFTLSAVTSLTKSVTIKQYPGKDITVTRSLANAWFTTGTVNPVIDGSGSGSLTFDGNSTSVTGVAFESANNTGTSGTDGILTLKGVTIKNMNNPSSGNTVVSRYRGTVVLEDVTFENCSASSTGIVYARNGNMKFKSSVTFTDCTGPNVLLERSNNARIVEVDLNKPSTPYTLKYDDSSVSTTGQNAVDGGTASYYRLTSDYPGWYLAKPSGTMLKAYKVSKQTYTLTVTSALMSTLVLPFGVTSLPANITAYKLTTSGSVVSAQSVSSITANEPVLIKATAAGNYAFTNSAETDASYSSPYTGYTNGALIGTYYSIDADDDNYVLQNGTDGVGFYKLAASSNHVINPFRAYLSGEENPSGARVLKIVFDDGETTGIEDAVKSEELKVKSYYDLSGRRVAQPTKGLYIVNGKKVIIK